MAKKRVVVCQDCRAETQVRLADFGPSPIKCEKCGSVKVLWKKDGKDG